jgi:hypothetical protein
MQSMPENAQSFPPPPPPPPRRSRKGLWIGLAIAVIVLCLCCIVLVAGVYFFQINIPVLSNFFPSPTPTGLFYSNPQAGISLTYPATWQYSDSGDASNGFTIIFASSADVLKDSTNAPTSGAAMAIITNILTTGDLSFPVDANSMGAVVDYIATTYFNNITGGQNLRTFTLNGNPAASGVYTLTDTSGPPSNAYLTAVLRGAEIILFFGVCPQTEWSKYQSAFESIVNSSVIVTP